MENISITSYAMENNAIVDAKEDAKRREKQRIKAMAEKTTVTIHNSQDSENVFYSKQDIIGQLKETLRNQFGIKKPIQETIEEIRAYKSVDEYFSLFERFLQRNIDLRTIVQLFGFVDTPEAYFVLFRFYSSEEFRKEFNLKQEIINPQKYTSCFLRGYHHSICYHLGESYKMNTFSFRVSKKILILNADNVSFYDDFHPVFKKIQS